MADLNIGNSTANVIVNAKHNGSVNPQINNTYDLGTSDLRWKNIYGSLKGNADTATTATNLASAGTWTWTGGTTAGPTASLVLGGKTTSIGAIPSASSSASGIITTGTQTIAGEKTFTSNLLIKKNTPNLYITDTNTGVETYSIIRFGSTNASGTTNANAAYIFLNGPQRINDGGANLMTIRNNVGDLILDNDVINTGKLTIGQANKNASYKLYVNGNSYFNGTQYIQSNSNSSTTNGLTINNGILSISNYNQTLSIGAQNTSWTHFQTTGSQFYFNKQIHIDGNLTKHNYSNAGYGTISGYNLAGNAATATISRSLGTDDTMKVYGQYNDEVDFGGTNNSSTIYFGYRAVDSKPIPSKFIFGGNSGTAELVAAKFTGTLNGNANTATKFDSAQSITLTGDTTGTASSQAGWSIGTTTSKLSNAGHLDTVEKLDGFIEDNKLKYATVASVGGVNSDGMIISVPWSSSGWGHQVFLDDSNMVIQHRHKYVKTNSDGSTAQAWSGWATLLDSNNYTETLDGRYVNVTGDTMSGDLTAPSVYTSNWFRSTGSTGWYNESYGGGIYMKDSNWVRISHSKKFRTDNTAFIYSYATSSAIPAIVMDKRGSYLVGIGPDDTSNRIKFGPANEGGASNASWIDIDTFNSNEWYFQGYGVFTNTLTSAYHNFIIGGNEVNFCPDSGTDGALWFNYVSGSSRNSLTKAIHSYYFGNGQKDWNTTHIYAGAVHNAVWNDYAECREAVTNEPGRVLYEQGDDTLSITIERLQHFAGIVSDTYGVIQGETEKAKTPIAVAGRVLAYPYQNRNNYKPGDCVCAAPGGTVDIMTREEIIQYPDRIVGTVSCVPNYEEWGTGKVKVDGRIWIKVR